jgi:hypothetical protein
LPLCQADAFFGRILERGVDPRDAALDRGPFAVPLGHVAREDADHRRTEDGRTIDPGARHGELLVAGLTFRQAEIVADGRAGNVEPQAKRLLLQLQQIGVVDIGGEVVGGRLAAVEIELRAEVDEIVERHLRLGKLGQRPIARQQPVERVRRQAQLHV